MWVSGDVGQLSADCSSSIHEPWVRFPRASEARCGFDTCHSNTPEVGAERSELEGTCHSLQRDLEIYLGYMRYCLRNKPEQGSPE